MKLCTGCKKEKPLEDFSPKKESKDGKHSRCRKCISQAMKKNYHANPEKKKIQNEILQKKIADVINTIKKQTGCNFCPEKEPVCLDFHHLNPKNKKKDVSYFVKAKSIKKALKEIKKCVCVCANCHRKIHANLIILHP